MHGTLESKFGTGHDFPIAHGILSKQAQNILIVSMCPGSMQARGVCLDGRSGDSLEGSTPSGGRVHLNSDGQLVWPVLFLYPEYGQSDYIEAMPETDR